MHREEGPVQEQEGLEKVQEDLREVLSCGCLARNLSVRHARSYIVAGMSKVFRRG